MQIISIHEVDQAKLAGVMAEMATLGSPTIRAVEYGGQLVAIEGVHRLAAAKRLGVAVNVEIVEGAIASESLDDGMQDWIASCDAINDDGMVSADALAELICTDWAGDCYRIAADGVLE